MAVEAGHEWVADKTAIYAAALAYHALLALAPLVVIAVGVLGLIYGANLVPDLSDQAEQHMGTATSDAVKVILESWSPKAGTNTIVVVVGAGVMLFAAAGAFRALRKAFNAIFGVEPAPAAMKVRSLARVALNQVSMVIMVFGLCFVLAVLIGLSTLWSWLSGNIETTFSGSQILLRAGNVVFSYGATAVAMSLLYLAVPMASMKRGDRWLGALLSAVLFLIGKEAFTVYISHSSTASAYGAAGSLVVFLIWVYYSAMMLFYGAEFAKVYGRRHDHQIRPRKGAQRIRRLVSVDALAELPATQTASVPVAEPQSAPAQDPRSAPSGSCQPATESTPAKFAGPQPSHAREPRA